MFLVILQSLEVSLMLVVSHLQDKAMSNNVQNTGFIYVPVVIF